MKSELQRYKEALAGARHALEMIGRNPQVLAHADYLTAVQRELDDILNPPAEMETVEVVRWECKTCGTMSKSQDVNAGNSCCWGIDTLIPLTGSFQRPKPQPVERSESISGIQINKIGRFRYDSPAIEFPAAKGKTVTLMAVWEE